MKTIFLAFLLLFSLNGFAQKKQTGVPASNYQVLNGIINGQNNYYKVCIVATKPGNIYIMDFINCADSQARDGKIEFNLNDRNLNFIQEMRRGGWELSSVFVFNNVANYLFVK